MATPATIGKTPFDSAIIEGFSRRWSAEEVSMNPPISGSLTPAQCLSRLQKLIASHDVLDAKDSLSLLLEDVYFLRNKLRDQMEDASYIDKDTAAAWLKTIEAAATRIDKANIGLNDAMLRFTEVRAREFVEALNYVYAKFIDEVSSRYPEIQESSDELRVLVLDAIPDSLPEVK